MMNQMGEKDLILSLRAQGASVAEARDLVVVAGALAVVPDPEIDAAFADALEAKLMASFDAQNAPSNVTQLRPAQRASQPAPAAPVKAPIAAVIPLPRRKLVIRKAMAAAIAAALMLALPVAASANALPSSPMYRGKLALEDIRGFFTHGTAKGFFMLQRAKIRGNEIAQEAALGHTAVLAKTAQLMQAEQEEGAKLILDSHPSQAELAQAANTLGALSAQLSGLLNQVPAALRSAVTAALNTANAIREGIASTLGQPAIAFSVPAITAPAAPSTVQAPASDGSSNTSTSGGTTSQSSDPTGNTKGNGGNHHTGDITTPEPCQVPGSANGLSDVTAPLAKVFCS